MVVEEKSVSTSKVTPRSLVTQGHALVLLLHFGMQNFFSPKARTHVLYSLKKNGCGVLTYTNL